MERRVSRGEDGSVTAVVVAVAAMERLGWTARLTDILDPVDVLPQAGQGAIAVQCRADDGATRELLSSIDDVPSHRALRAERSVLAGLGGSCTVPVGAWAEASLGSPGCACTVWWPAPTGARSSEWPGPGPIRNRWARRWPGRSWSMVGDGASTGSKRRAGHCPNSRGTVTVYPGWRRSG